MHLLASNQIEKNTGWGAEWFLDKGFSAEGATVVNVDYKLNQFSLCRAFSRVADQHFDGFFLQRGDYFPHDVLEALPRPRVFWATELVSRRPDQWPNLRSELFDYVYVRSDPCYQTVVQAGWKDPSQVSVLSSGFSRDVFHPLPYVEKDIDAVFVGSPMPRRDALLDQLSEYVSVVRTRAYGSEMNELFNRARIVLNLHSEEFPDTETRVYEALGSGAFLLTEPLSSESPFVVGRDLVEANGLENLLKAIDYYLRHPGERQEIALRGLQTAQNFTYNAHARRILDQFQALQEKGIHVPNIQTRVLKRAAWKEPLRAIGWGLKRTAFRAQRKARHTLKRAAKR